MASQTKRAWTGDWELLLGPEGPAVLETHDGEVLAWTGSGAERPVEGVVAMASEESFLLKGCWDLLRVNVRMSELVEMDLRGLCAGAHFASERIVELIGRTGARSSMSKTHPQRKKRRSLGRTPFPTARLEMVSSPW